MASRFRLLSRALRAQTCLRSRRSRPLRASRDSSWWMSVTTSPSSSANFAACSASSQAGLLPVHADLGIALAVRNARHGQIHADLAALARRSWRADRRSISSCTSAGTSAPNTLPTPTTCSAAQVFSSACSVNLLPGTWHTGALRRGRIAFMNVTANRANPLFHNKILHQINFSLCCFYYRPLRSSGRCRKMSEPRSAPRRAFRR